MTTVTDQIAIAQNGAVATVSMVKPARRNALGRESVHGLKMELAALAANPDVRAIVLTGVPPAFCAGSDLKELGALDVAGMCAHEAETADAVRQIGFLPVPVIAAVEGYALGGGCALALACDVVVTANGAKWAMPEVANGWIPPWGLQPLLARVGPVVARRVVWGVEPIDGADAHRLGLADFAVEDGKALEAAQAYAARLADLPPGAVASTKRYFESAAIADAERQDREANRLFALDAATEASQATLARFKAPAGSAV